MPALSIDDPTVTVVAPDRSGLLAEVTGVLALHGLNVRSAVVAGEDGVAVEIFTVEPSRGRWPAAARLADDLAAVMAGNLSIETSWPSGPAPTATNAGPPPHTWCRPRSRWTTTPRPSATVVEVRAEDVVGQLHRITQALVDCQLDVTSAKVSTFGSAVVDAFYVRGPDGAKVTDVAPDQHPRGDHRGTGWREHRTALSAEPADRRGQPRPDRPGAWCRNIASGW